MRSPCVRHAMCWPCSGSALPDGVLQWQGWQTLFLVVRLFLCTAGACSCYGTSPQKNEHPSGRSSEGCNLLFNRTSLPLSQSVAWTTEHYKDWSMYGHVVSSSLLCASAARSPARKVSCSGFPSDTTRPFKIYVGVANTCGGTRCPGTSRFTTVISRPTMLPACSAINNASRQLVHWSVM